MQKTNLGFVFKLFLSQQRKANACIPMEEQMFDTVWVMEIIYVSENS